MSDPKPETEKCWGCEHSLAFMKKMRPRASAMNPIVLVRGVLVPRANITNCYGNYLTQEEVDILRESLPGKPVNVDHDEALTLGKVASAYMDRGNLMVDLVLSAKNACKYACGTGGEYKQLSFGYDYDANTHSISRQHVALVRKCKMEDAWIQDVRVISKY